MQLSVGTPISLPGVVTVYYKSSIVLRDGRKGTVSGGNYTGVDNEGKQVGRAIAGGAVSYCSSRQLVAQLSSVCRCTQEDPVKASACSTLEIHMLPMCAIRMWGDMLLTVWQALGKGRATPAPIP